jgi:hypothetical protein
MHDFAGLGLYPGPAVTTAQQPALFQVFQIAADGHFGNAETDAEFFNMDFPAHRQVAQNAVPPLGDNAPVLLHGNPPAYARSDIKTILWLKHHKFCFTAIVSPKKQQEFFIKNSQ